MCVLSILLRTKFHTMVHIPATYQFQMIAVFFVNINKLLGDVILVILLVIPRYLKNIYFRFIQ